MNHCKIHIWRWIVRFTIQLMWIAQFIWFSAIHFCWSVPDWSGLLYYPIYILKIFFWVEQLSWSSPFPSFTESILLILFVLKPKGEEIQQVSIKPMLLNKTRELQFNPPCFWPEKEFSLRHGCLHNCPWRSISCFDFLSFKVEFLFFI